MIEFEIEPMDFNDNEESDAVGFLEKSRGRRARMERSAKIRKRRSQIKAKLDREYDSGFRGAYDIDCN